MSKDLCPPVGSQASSPSPSWESYKNDISASNPPGIQPSRRQPQPAAPPAPLSPEGTQDLCSASVATTQPLSRSQTKGNTWALLRQSPMG